MKDLARLMKTFSEPARLKILWVLSRVGEACVCDLEEVLGMSQSSVSHHVSCLKRAGILDDRREAQWLYCRILPTRNLPRGRLLRALLKEVEGVAESKELERRLRKRLRVRPERARCK